MISCYVPKCDPKLMLPTKEIYSFTWVNEFSQEVYFHEADPLIFLDKSLLKRNEMLGKSYF